MDFSLTEEQQLLQDSINQFIEREYTFDDRKKYLDSEKGFNEENWKTFGSLGWLGMPFSEVDGGYNGGPVDVMVIMENLGKGLIVEPYVPSILLSGKILADLGSDDQKSNYLHPMISGEKIITFAYIEPQSRFNLSDCLTKATVSDDGFVLDGYKALVHSASASDTLIVSARTSGNQCDEKGISLFLVDANAKGVSLRNYSTIDGGKASELTLENVTVPKDSLLGVMDEGFSTIDNAIDLATLGICAEAVGIMGKMNEMTLEYTKTREQFEQKLSQFQALQHRMVDNFMHYEQSKSLLVMCAAKMNDNTEDKKKALASLKYQIGLSGKHIGEESIQLHGGMGVTDEMHIGHYFKRLTTIRTLYGNSDYHLSNYASL